MEVKRFKHRSSLHYAKWEHWPFTKIQMNLMTYKHTEITLNNNAGKWPTLDLGHFSETLFLHNFLIILNLWHLSCLLSLWIMTPGKKKSCKLHIAEFRYQVRLINKKNPLGLSDSAIVRTCHMIKIRIITKSQERQKYSWVTCCMYKLRVK